LWQHIHGYRVSSGGLWIPKNSTDKLRLFVYVDEEDYSDRTSALTGTGGRIVPGSRDTRSPSIKVTVVNSAGVEARPAAGSIAGSVASGLLSAEMERDRGKVLLMFEIENAALDALTRQAMK
jgi:hypothetical protein